MRHPNYDPEDPKEPKVVLPCKDGDIYTFGFKVDELPLEIRATLTYISPSTHPEVFNASSSSPSTSPPKK